MKPNQTILVEPGLYMFLRDPATLSGLRQSTRPEWIWQKTGPSAPVSIVALRFARHSQIDLLPPRYRRRLLFCAGDAGEVRSCFA